VEKGIASLAYMGILAIVPLLYAQKSAFVRMHALEGLNLLIYTAALGALCYVADFSWALSIAVFALMCCGVANALRGVKRNLPFVGRFKIVRGL
jgi:uncharacterized membrane protein